MPKLSVAIFIAVLLVLAKVLAARAKEYSASDDIEVRRTAMSLNLGVFFSIVLAICGTGLLASLFIQDV